MTGLLKFSVKAGILGGAVYYSRDIGVWADSDTTYELGKKSIAYLTPYINKLEKEVPIPVDLKNLPSSEDACRTVKTYWNRGVISSITFIEKIPSNISYYSCQGISYISEQIQQEKNSLPSSQEKS
ncbi:MICOS complex subunit MIC13 homolog QIL1 [Planococcus citri]|uniref:MICOS complex subunit MIC13 homolog QIL1 n=1 Tax=Planococcus citri TaxID=170843 RepID=UPI0031F99A31